MKPGIALIGPGKVGSAVARRLLLAGYPIQAVIGPDLDRAADSCRFIGCPSDLASTEISATGTASIILLAVPDDQIARLAKEVCERTPSLAEKTLIHFCGLHPASIMQTGNRQVATLSIHPLLPFADRQIASERLIGCPCALEGDEQSILLGAELVKALGGRPFLIASDKKALYHASACIASNFLITLQATAAELLAECGIEADQAIQLLLPMVQATLDNVAKLGPEKGLTGPIVRGDEGTVALHLSALENTPTDSFELYKLLGSRTVALAEKSTRLSSEQADKIQRLFKSSALADKPPGKTCEE